MILESLVVRIAADTRKLESGIKKSLTLVQRFSNMARRGFTGMKNVVGKVTRSIFSLKGALLGLGLGMIAKSFLDVANTTEQLRIRLQYIIGSVEEGNRLFNEMSKFAGNVAYEYNDIMQSATALAGVMKGGVEEVKQWMPMIADLATVSGLSINDTTQQIIRMYSAGAAAADLFRERGVLAMLGFQAGVSYSAEETRKKLLELYPKAEWKDAAQAMASTWSGTMSMIADKWFRLRDQIMQAGLFNTLKAAAQAFDKWFDSATKSGRERIKLFSQTMSNAVVSAIRMFGYLIDAGRIVLVVIENIGMAWMGWKIILKEIKLAIGNLYKKAFEGWNWLIDKISMALPEFEALKFDMSAFSDLDALEKEIANTRKEYDQINKSMRETASNIGKGVEEANKFANEVENIKNKLDRAAESGRKLAKSVRPTTEEEKRWYEFVKNAEAFGKSLKNSLGETLNPLDDYAKKLAYIDYLFETTNMDMDTYFELMDKYMSKFNQSIDEVSNNTKKLGRDWENILSNIKLGIADAIMKARTWKEVLRDVAKQIVRLLITKYISEPIVQGISNISARASGGPVASGTPYIVGEKGPELFVPNTYGSIVPNSSLASANSGVVNIYQEINVSGSGDRELQMKLEQAASRGAEQGYAKVMEDLRRNGPLRGSIR